MARNLLFLIVLTCNWGYAQLATDSAPANLLMYPEFLGPNYTVSNVQFSGSMNAIGSFDATNTPIGLSTGIILTTGTVLNDTLGPIGPNNSSNEGFDNGYPGAAILQSLTSATLYNGAVLEFDFIPSVDSIELSYVFGSEEYPEFAPPNNSGFNDIFAIYLSGAGIPGYQNIARLPNSEIVGINTVNPINNTTYYVNNGDGFTPPFNIDPNYIEYDGYTTVLKAKASLLPGELYHIAIATSDAGDGIYDSGIFIESCTTCNFAVGLSSISTPTRLYPNPANQSLHFDAAQGPIKVRCYSAIGELMQETETTGILDVSHLSQGLYWFEYTMGTVNYKEKILIKH